MLLPGIVQFTVEQHALLVRLAAAFFGGCDGQTVLRERIDDAAVLGRAAIDRALAGVGLGVELCQGGLRRGNCRLQFRQLRLQRPQLTPPRNQAGGHAVRPNGECPVRFEQIAGKRDVGEACAAAGGQREGQGEGFDKPCPPQQPLGQRGKLGRGLYKSIRPPKNARGTVKIGSRRRGIVAVTCEKPAAPAKAPPLQWGGVSQRSRGGAGPSSQTKPTRPASRFGWLRR